MESKKVRYIIALAVIMISLAVYSFMVSNGTAPTSNTKKAKTWDDVKVYQYEHTPGLKRAEQYGLTREYSKTVKIPDTPYELTIDEIWYNETGGYLFYHLNTSRSSQINFNVNLTEYEYMLPSHSYSGNIFPGEGIVYDEKFYSQVRFPNLVEVDTNEPLKNIDSILLEHLTVEIGENSFSLDNPITLAIDYDINNEVVKRYEIDKDIQVMEHSVHVDYIEIGTVENKLVVSYKAGTPNTYLSYINWNLNTDQLYHSSTRTMTSKDSVQAYTFPLLNDDLTKLELFIHSFHFIGEDSIEIDIDLSEYTNEIFHKGNDNNKEIELNEKLTNIRNTDVYLENLIFRKNDMMIGFEYKQPEKMEKPYEQLIEGSANIKYDALHPYPEEFVVGMWTDIRNELGEQHDSGGDFVGPEHRWGVGIKQELLEMSKTISINVENLVYEIVGDWEITVPVK